MISIAGVQGSLELAISAISRDIAHRLAVLFALAQVHTAQLQRMQVWRLLPAPVPDQTGGPAAWRRTVCL